MKSLSSLLYLTSVTLRIDHLFITSQNVYCFLLTDQVFDKLAAFPHSVFITISQGFGRTLWPSDLHGNVWQQTGFHGEQDGGPIEQPTPPLLLSHTDQGECVFDQSNFASLCLSTFFAFFFLPLQSCFPCCDQDLHEWSFVCLINWCSFRVLRNIQLKLNGGRKAGRDWGTYICFWHCCCSVKTSVRVLSEWVLGF